MGVVIVIRLLRSIFGGVAQEPAGRRVAFALRDPAGNYRAFAQPISFRR
jgi:hypothetical protein